MRISSFNRLSSLLLLFIWILLTVKCQTIQGEQIIQNTKLISSRKLLQQQQQQQKINKNINNNLCHQQILQEADEKEKQGKQIAKKSHRRVEHEYFACFVFSSF